MRGDGADRRNDREAPADLRFHLRRHEIAASRRRHGRDRLRLKPLQAVHLAACAHRHRTPPCARWPRASLPGARRAELRPAALQHQAVEQALLAVERGVDARDLLFGHHVGGKLLSISPSRSSFAVLERLERAEEIVEGVFQIARRRLGELVSAAFVSRAGASPSQRSSSGRSISSCSCFVAARLTFVWQRCEPAPHGGRRIRACASRRRSSDTRRPSPPRRAPPAASGRSPPRSPRGRPR